MFTSYEDNNCLIIPKVLKNVEIMFYFVVDNKIISGIENTITEPDWKQNHRSVPSTKGTCQKKMVRSGGIEWLIFKYIYNIKMYLHIKMLALNCKSCLQNSMLWRSIISIKLVFYIISVVYWNIGCTESCM
jgi:hypothetical protein